MRASFGGLRRSFFSLSPGRWVRPWPGAPRCWPRLRPVPGVFCRSLLLPNSAFDKTLLVERSFSSCTSSFSARDASTALSSFRSRTSARSRALSSHSDAIRSVARTVPTRTERGVAMVLIELEKKKLANLTFSNLLKLGHFIEFQCWKIPSWSNFKPSPTAGSDPRRPRSQRMGAG